MLSLLLSCLVLGCGGSGGSGGGGEADAAAGGSDSALVAAGPVLNAGSASPVAAQAPAKLEFEFELPAARQTSAGIYSEDGTLVRTLWRGERRGAGRHLQAWDQRRDDGSIAPPGRYTVRVVHHDVRYVWQGVIGNHSARSGSVPYRSFYPPQSLVADATHLHMGVGYNEGQSAIQGLLMSLPGQSASRVRHVDPFVGLGLLAADGTRLYAANTGGLSKRGFVMAFDVGSGRQTGFADGSSLCLNPRSAEQCHPAQAYSGVIAVREASEAPPTGLAVQRDGPVLAVAYGGENRVRLFDKLSGQPLGLIETALGSQSRQQLAITPQGDLWIVGPNSVSRYTQLASGQPSLAARIDGLVQPLAAVAHPSEPDALWVAEGGARQQLQRFTAGGVQVQSLGRPGALRARAEVGEDTFCFDAGPYGEHTALAVEPNAAAVWLVDSCNNRLLRIDPAGRLIGQAAYLPHVYTMAVDPARPARVFANFLEFEVDHAQADPSAPGAWRLLRNWLPGLPSGLRDALTANWGFGGFRGVQTLANGRTYAILQVTPAGTTRAVQVLLELRADGRSVEIFRTAPGTGAQTGWVLHDNGDLRWASDEGGWQVVWRRRLEGFAADGAPRWAMQAEEMARVPRGAATPHHRMGTFTGSGEARFPLTANGQLVFFDGGVEGNDGFHLGAAALGGRSFTWQASPSGPLDGLGSFQTRRSDPRLQYAGNVAMTSGRSIVYGYHGEFYTDLGNGRVGQANQFMHYLDNGLFLGQFGMPSTRDDIVDATTPGRSGNAFSPWLVREGTRLYLLHNDESTWGGVHRWWLSGVDDLVELSASGSVGERLRLR